MRSLSVSRLLSSLHCSAPQAQWVYLLLITGMLALLSGGMASCSPVGGENQITLKDAQHWSARFSLMVPDESLLTESITPRLNEAGVQFQWEPAGAISGQAAALVLQGSGGIDQIRSLLYSSPIPDLDPLNGPVALELSGQVHPDQSISFTLESNLTTGFLWNLTQYDSQLLAPDGTSQFQTGPGRIGAPTPQTFRFKSRAEGWATLRLLYDRPNHPAEGRVHELHISAPEISLLTSLENPAPRLDGFSLPEPPLGGEALLPEAVSSTLPAVFDWRTQAQLPPVRDQGGCGSCWAFATVGALETNIAIQDGYQADLSEQYLVSCNNDGWSCDGGIIAHDYHQDRIPPPELKAGAVPEANFPYTASDQSCENPHAHTYKIQSFHDLTWNVPNVALLKQAIYEHGPVSATICAGSGFGSYRGGLFSQDESAACSGTINHAIVLVGWDDTQGPNGAWILRNSWGSWWGEDGYMLIDRTVSNVGAYASYVVYAGARWTPTQTTTLTCGAQISRNTLSASQTTNQAFGYSCSNRDESGAETVYSFVPAASGQITARLSGLSADLDLFVLGSTQSEYRAGDCAAWGDQQVSFSVTAGQPVALAVDGHNGAAGNYTLSIDCADGVETVAPVYLPIVKK